jgi:hypothetical protein
MDKKQNPCADCANNPENGAPAKLCTPKGAVRAMLAGRVLMDKRGLSCFWDNYSNAFFYKDENGAVRVLDDFSGLYAEEE